jgi:glyoxylase-like metal-dependent hydrolase (beta-lactamase superfamily II)/rhodanese-related sulfurtransferase
MIIKQFYLDCLSHASYLVADETTKTALVVDPRRDITDYLDEAARLDVRIDGVINTHFHADFVSGHLEFAKATGAWIGFGAAAETEFPIRRLHHGEHISLGEVDVEILSTPGHTWESISLLVRERADATPAAVLTGDSLFIGDVGRPDLANLGDGTNTDLARAMYRTIHQTLLQLPDTVQVMPAHGAGSSCGKNLSTELVSTIGEQRRDNYALQPMSEDAFVDLIVEGQPPIPGYFNTDADLNRRAHRILDSDRSVTELSSELVRAHLSYHDTVFIDTRSPEQFAAGHLRGTINVGLGGRYAETCGMVAGATDRIVFITAPGDEHEAMVRLARIGYDNVAGFFNVSNSAAAFPQTLQDIVEVTDRLSPEELSALLAQNAVTLLDVRNAGERDMGSIEGSLHIPLPQLLADYAAVPHDKPVVVHCQSGWRSSVAASLLRSHGYHDTTDLDGGYIAWQER